VRLLEVVEEVEGRRVVEVLRILPFRHTLRGDGKLDADGAMRMAGQEPPGMALVQQREEFLATPGRMSSPGIQNCRHDLFGGLIR
jgi:hypothetical protein